MFKWPNVFDIWNTYLTKFIHRYVSLITIVSVYCTSKSCFLYNIFAFKHFFLFFPRVAANLSEQEIYLNKFSRAVRLNLLNVRLFYFFLILGVRY